MEVILTLGFCLFLFLVMREVMMWYWKVNTMLENQEKIIKLLEDQQKFNNERSRTEDKHYNYMENNIYSIKESVIKPEQI